MSVQAPTDSGIIRVDGFDVTYRRVDETVDGITFTEYQVGRDLNLDIRLDPIEDEDGTWGVNAWFADEEATPSSWSRTRAIVLLAAAQLADQLNEAVEQ